MTDRSYGWGYFACCGMSRVRGHAELCPRSLASVTGTGTAETLQAARGEACQNGPQGDAQTPQSQSVPPLEPPHNTRKG